MTVVDAILDELRGANFPLYLYGKGTSTNRIIDYLGKNNVPISGILVDHDYYESGERIKGLDVACLEEFLLDHECELLICTGDWKESDFKEPYRNNIKRVHAHDFWGLFAIEEWNLWDEGFLRGNGDDLTWLRNILRDEKSRFVYDENKKQRTTLCYSRAYDDPSIQYFDPEIVSLTDHEVFVDCGAYHGENLVTLQKILGELGGVSWAFEFEADANNVDRLRQNIKDIKNTTVIGKAVWGSSGTLYLGGSQEKSSKVSSEGGVPLEVTTIDEVCAGYPVTFIKMDVEGAELQALRGAERTIRENRPKLAVSVYHRPQDFIDIPKWIDSLGLDYRLYLRCYSQTGCETILYAV